MYIKFSPRRRAGTLTASKVGDVLTLNGEQFDFSSLPDGAAIPAGAVPCDWILGPVERVEGDVHLTLILPHGSSPSAAVAFPEPLAITADGPIDLPHDPEPTHVEP